MNPPLLTVGIPAYNRPEMLAEAMAILAAVAESGTVNFEVVICDDGPTAGAEKLAEDFPGGRCRYLPNRPALGAVGNWNRCLVEARGEWVTVLHEDDLLYPNYFSLVVPRLHPSLVAIGVQTDVGEAPPAGRVPPRGMVSAAGAAAAAHAGMISTPGHTVARPAENYSTRTPSPARSAFSLTRSIDYPPRYFLKSSITPFPGVLVRKSAAEDLGGFDESWGPLADYDFWYRLACAGRVKVVRARGAFYRVAPGQWTDRTWARMLRLTHLLRLRIAREQFPRTPGAGRWLARFFTYRNALSYMRRFRERPAALDRALKLGRIPGARALPSGWVWQALKLIG